MERRGDERGEALLRAHRAAGSHTLRYTAVHPVNLDGWLSKEGKALRARCSRFVTLNGHILSSHRSKGSPPSWHVSVAHAVVEKGPHPREIKLALPHRALSFIAPNQHAFEKWIVSLRRASVVSSHVEEYYNVGRLIGEGMNGQVRLAHDLLTDEQVAVKMVPRLNRENETQFLAREIQIILSVSHPNVVRTIDVFVRSRRIHFVMEYLAGGELFDFIAENSQFTEAHAATVMLDLLNALSYLHSRGIAHRDVKLENLLCANTTWPLNVKLADFGFANYVSKTDEPMLSSFVGTPYYIAPEMLRGSPHGQAVDVWASGVVLYILLSGKFPFGGKNESEYYQRVLSKEAYFPNEEWSNVSEDAKNLVRGMLCKDPRRRLTAEQCLKHPWMRRSEVIDSVTLDGEVFPVDPMPSALSDAGMDTINSQPPIHIRAMSDADAEMPASESVGRAATPPSSHKSRFRKSEKQHFLRTPGMFKDNREKKGKSRYLGMLNHSINAPTPEMLATRAEADIVPHRPTPEVRESAAPNTPTSFDEILPSEEPTMYRRPSLIRRLLSSGKLSLDRYDCRFPSFRGSVEEHADEASATPRKTLSLFSKDGPLRRSFHRGGENRSTDDGINFVDANAQRLPPKIARERQRQQRLAAASRRASRGHGIFSHRKSATQQYTMQQQQSEGYHSSPRLQAPLHPLSSIPTPPGQRGPVPGPSLIGNSLMKRRMTAGAGAYMGSSQIGVPNVPNVTSYGSLQNRGLSDHIDDGTVRRTMSADVTPVGHFSTNYISSQSVTGRL
ncbi:Serine/threonine-protein kinase [Chondrus crispus]|uniref:Serine/threonine-protein kinase n=1 Tax=Chondrus crispus TaxID=2769 RepID=R7QHA8_CHOCR|nr:Serine/threonine-protein kinase [Chondrus crispus]CDF36810.1 Serine/threonine-protein kinase [Chondrus crispus]|eukprot:XP_005716629.1 Serine/threonine-protein kinase [Chondrus crispus]